jgi:phytoene synthase
MSQITTMIRSDALHCERVVRRHARTFTLASYFLPVRKRRASFALYCLGRTAADLVESSGDDRKCAARKLLAYRRELVEALDGRPKGPVLREVRWAVREFEIPPPLLFDYLDAVSLVFSPTEFETWDDLERHCDAIVSSVSSMCTYVVGIPGGPRQEAIAIAHARTLGIAMRLTSILRDVGSNARSGHCYLPSEELSRFGLDRDEVFDPDIARDPRWHRLMTFEISRARALYDKALPGVAMLSPDSQKFAAACSIGYAAVLDALENLRYDSLSSRASVGTIARLGVLWDAWRFKSRAS